jgi:hypothetical protein
MQVSQRKKEREREREIKKRKKETPIRRVLLEILTVVTLVKKSPTFYATRKAR